MAITIDRIEEHAAGISWLVAEAIDRTSHAVLADGRVWIIDPVDAPEAMERVAALGPPAAVVQLLDRHNRDCAAIAERLGVPHLRLPGDVPGSGIEAFTAVSFPGWREVALWWPAQQALLVAELLGSNAYYTGGSGRVGMHFMVRATAPGSVRGYRPRHLLLGHGTGVHGDEAAEELERAYHRARRDLPRLLLKLPFSMR